MDGQTGVGVEFPANMRLVPTLPDVVDRLTFSTGPTLLSPWQALADHRGRAGAAKPNCRRLSQGRSGVSQGKFHSDPYFSFQFLDSGQVSESTSSLALAPCSSSGTPRDCKKEISAAKIAASLSATNRLQSSSLSA